MSWEAITALGTVFTGVVIIATAIVGVGQLRQLYEQRRDAAAVELVRSLQDETFSHAFALIFSLPPEVSASDLRARGAEYEEAALVLSFRFEMLGVLIHRGTISFEVTEEVVGGGIVSVWRRLKEVIRETRVAMKWPAHLEWFQWLAEQFEKRGRLQQTPAYVRYRDWTPARPTSVTSKSS
jgi:hypothetical protein